MKLIAIIDDNYGMMFNNRRQSKVFSTYRQNNRDFKGT